MSRGCVSLLGQTSNTYSTPASHALAEALLSAVAKPRSPDPVDLGGGFKAISSPTYRPGMINISVTDNYAVWIDPKEATGQKKSRL